MDKMNVDAYESNCPDCGACYHWEGLKFGRTDEEKAKLHRDKTVCRNCGLSNLSTGHQHGPEPEPDAALFVASLIIDMLKKRD